MTGTRLTSPLLHPESFVGQDGAVWLWTVRPSVEAFPYLADHRLQGRAVLPGSAYVELAYAAATAVYGSPPVALEDLTFDRVFPVPARPGRSLQILLLPRADGTADFAVNQPESGPAGVPVRHATARVRCPPAGPSMDQLADAEPIGERPRGREMDGAAFYARLRTAGNDYGSAFQAVERVWCRSDGATASLNAPAVTSTGTGTTEYLVHPAILDAGVQVLASAADDQGHTLVLTGCLSVRRYAPLTSTRWIWARLAPRSPNAPNEVVGEVRLVDGAGQPTADLIGVRLRRLAKPAVTGASDRPARTRFAISATFTAEPLGDALSFWGETLGLPVEVAFAPYAQPFQQLLDPASLQSTNLNGANVVLIRPEDLLHRTARPARAGEHEALLAGRPRVTLPGIGEIAHIHGYETEFLFDEIFLRDAYLRHGITLPDDARVFDIGANIGMFMLLVHQKCREAQVYAVEPSPAAFEALRVNATLHCPSTRLFNCGMSDRDTIAPFTFYPHSTLFSGFDADARRDRAALEAVVENVLCEKLPSIPPDLKQLVARVTDGRLDAESFSCATRTVSSVLRDEGVDRIDLLKIDTEGAEMRILSGIEDEHWPLIRQVVVEVHEGAGVSCEEVAGLLRRRGYDVVAEPEGELLRGTGFVTVFARRVAGPAPVSGTPVRTAEEDWLRHDVAALIKGIEGLQRRITTPCIVGVCPPSPTMLADEARGRLIAHAEQGLVEGLTRIPGVIVLTPADLARSYPVADYTDPRSAALAYQPFTSRFFVALATLIIRRYVAAQHPAPYKVIVVDCDETLWSGRCGEDGPSGVRVDDTRRYLQSFLVEQNAAGMLVCLCSANNAPDVLAVFEHRNDMPLGLRHLAAWRLDWAPKSASLVSLAYELGLGSDSFVFIDDDPVVCAEVQANCPGVLVLPLPAAADIPRFLRHVWAFDRSQVTAEDRSRTIEYWHQRQRRALQDSAPTFASFLNSLGLRIAIRPCAPADVPRAAQLTQRTNQFNTSTARYSTAQLRTLLESGQIECLVIEVSDRYGEYGLVGVLLFSAADEVLRAEAFLLSCRALGRGVEHRMLARLGQLATERGLPTVEVAFVPTARNESMRQFLDALPLERHPAPDEASPAGASVFRVAAEQASAVVFEPATAAPTSARPRGADASAPDRQHPISPSLYRRIAVEFSHLDAIVAAVERWRLRARPALASTYAPPADDVERDLADIWQHILGVNHVGIDDNFFELGGTSVRAVQLAAEVGRATGAEISTVDVFDRPTVRAMASMLRGGSGTSGAEWEARSAARLKRGRARRDKPRAVRGGGRLRRRLSADE